MVRYVTWFGVALAVFTVLLSLINLAGEYHLLMGLIAIVLVGIGSATGR